MSAAIDSKCEGKLKNGIEKLQLVVDEVHQSQMLSYLSLIEKWNKTYNLTAVRDKQEMIVRHLLDALSIVPYIGIGNEEIIDLGSGFGVPGVILAILNPDRKICCVDSSLKKTLFLQQVKRTLNLDNLEVIQNRIENIKAQESIDSKKKLVSRALASLEKMLFWTKHLMSPGTSFFAMKGQFPEAELKDIPSGYHIKRIIPIQVPFIEHESRHLVEVMQKV